MKRFLSKLLGATALFVLAIAFTGSMAGHASAAAGVRANVTYQARLMDASGYPVADGVYQVRFSLYDAAVAGTRLWTAAGTTAAPTPVNVSVQDGLFTVLLGDGVTQLPFGDLNWNSDSLYLGVTIGGDAEMGPRRPITAVPQAINSSQLGGMSASGTDTYGGESQFTINQASTTAATSTRSALDVRTNGTSLANDFILRGLDGFGSAVFTVNSQGSVTSSNLFVSGVVSTTQLFVNGQQVCLQDGTNCLYPAEADTFASVTARGATTSQALTLFAGATMNVLSVTDTAIIANLNATNLVATDATTTNLFSTVVSTTQLFVNGVTVCLNDGTNCPASFEIDTLASVTARGATTSVAVTFFGGVTTTDLNVTTELLSPSGTITALFWSDATGTNTTGTNAYFTNLRGSNASFADLLSTSSTFGQATATAFFSSVLTATNSGIVNATTTNLVFTNATGGVLSIVSVSATSLLVSGQNVCLANGTNCLTVYSTDTLAAITARGATTSVPVSFFGGVTSSNINVSGTANLANVNASSVSSTNGIIAALVSGAVSSTNLFSSSVWGTSASFTNLTVSGTLVCLANGTNCQPTTEIDNLLSVTNRGSVATATLNLLGGAIANSITVTSTLTVSGTVSSNLIPTTDLTFSLGTPSLRWNGNFGTVTTTNLFTTSLVGTTATFTNATATNFFASLVSSSQVLVNGFDVCLSNGTNCAPSAGEADTLATVTARGATSSVAVTFFGGVTTTNLNASSALIDGLSWTNATGTNTTGTNAFFASLSGTTGSFNELYSVSSTIGQATATAFFTQTFSATNAGIVNATTTNLAFTNASGASMIVTVLNSSTVNASTSNIGVATIGTANVTTGTIASLAFTGATGTSLSIGSVSATSLLVSGQQVCLANGTNCVSMYSTDTLAMVTARGATTSVAVTFFGGVTSSNINVSGTANLANVNASSVNVSGGISAATGSIAGLVTTNATATNVTTTNLFATNGFLTNATATNGFITSLITGAVSSTNLFSSSVWGTNASFTNLLVAGQQVCLADGTNCSYPVGTDTLLSVTNRGSVATATLTLLGGAIANNVTVTSTLTVSGTVSSDLIPTTDLSFALGTPSLRWNGNFGTVTTTNLIGTNGVFTNVTFTNATATNLFASLVSSSQVLVGGFDVCLSNGTNCAPSAGEADTLASVTARGATTSVAVTFFGGVTTTNLNATSALIDNLVSTNATATNVTTTNLVAVNGSISGLAWTNATGTNTTGTNAFFANLRGTTASFSELYSASTTLGQATATAFFTQTFTATNAGITNATTTNLAFTNASGASMIVTVLNAGTATVGTLTATTGTIASLTFTNATGSTLDVLSVSATSLLVSGQQVCLADGDNCLSATTSLQMAYDNGQDIVLADGKIDLSPVIGSSDEFAFSALGMTVTPVIGAGYDGLANSGFDLSLLNGDTTGTLFTFTDNRNDPGSSANTSFIWHNSNDNTLRLGNVSTVFEIGTDSFHLTEAIYGTQISSFNGRIGLTAVNDVDNSSPFSFANYGTSASILSLGNLNGFNTVYIGSDIDPNGVYGASTSSDLLFRGGSTGGSGTQLYVNVDGTNTGWRGLATVDMVCLADGTNCFSTYSTDTLAMVTARGATTSVAVTFFGGVTTTNLNASSATIDGLTSMTGSISGLSWSDATGTNTTGTNAFFANLRGTTGSFNELYSASSTLGQATATVFYTQTLTATDAGIVNATTTNLAFTNASGASMVVTVLNSSTVNASTSNIGSATIGTANVTTGTVTNLSFTNATGATLSIGSVSATSLLVSGQQVCLANGTNCLSMYSTDTLASVTARGATTSVAVTFFGGVTSSNINVSGTANLANVSASTVNVTGGISAATGSITGLVVTNGTTTNTTSTNLFATNGVITNVTSTNGFITSLVTGAVSSTNLFSSSVWGTNASFTNLLVAGQQVCLADGTNCSYPAEADTLLSVTNRGSVATATLNLLGGLTTNNVTVTSTLTVSGTVSSDLIPTTDLTFALGTPSLRWNGNFGTVTTTNLLTTNLIGTSATFTNATATNIFASLVSSSQILVGGYNVCLSNGTNCPAAAAEADTLASVTARGATTSVAVTFFGGVTTTNLNATSALIDGLVATNATATNVTSTNVFAVNGSITSLAWINATGTNTTGTNAFFANLRGTTGSFSELYSASSTLGQATATVFFTQTFTATNAGITNATATNLAFTNASGASMIVTVLNAGTATVGTLNATTGTISSFTFTNATGSTLDVLSVSATNLLVTGQLVCLANGNNCLSATTTLQMAYDNGKDIVLNDGRIEIVGVTGTPDEDIGDINHLNLYGVSTTRLLSIANASKTTAGLEILSLYADDGFGTIGTLFAFTDNRADALSSTSSAFISHIVNDFGVSSLTMGNTTSNIEYFNDSLYINNGNNYVGLGYGALEVFVDSDETGGTPPVLFRDVGSLSSALIRMTNSYGENHIVIADDQDPNGVFDGDTSDLLFRSDTSAGSGTQLYVNVDGTNTGWRGLATTDMLGAAFEEQPIVKVGDFDALPKTMSKANDIDGRTGIFNGVIFDLTNPYSPVALYTVSSTDSVIKGSRLYTIEDDEFTTDFLKIYDITNPSSPQTIGNFDLGSTSTVSDGRITVDGNTVYFATVTSVKIFDAKDPSAIVELGSVAVSGTQRNVSIAYNNGYLIYTGEVDYGPLTATSTLEVFDVRDPSAPVSVSHLEYPSGHYLSGDGRQDSLVHVSDRRAYVFSRDSNPLIRVYDLADPANPVERASIDPNDITIYDFAVSDSALFVQTGGDDGSEPSFQDWDITDRDAPVLRSELNGTDNSLDFFVTEGAYAFGINGNEDLRILGLGGLKSRAATFASANLGQLTVGTRLTVRGNAEFNNGITVDGRSVCLSDGTNCPASSIVSNWSFNPATGSISPATSTNDIIIGSVATSTGAPFYFETNQNAGTSTLFVGYNTSSNLIIGGTSSSFGFMNADFAGGFNGNDLFVGGNIGSASSVYTNGEFVVGNASMHIGNGYIRKTDGDIILDASSGFILPGVDGVSLGSAAFKFSAYLNNTSSTNATTTNLFASGVVSTTDLYVTGQRVCLENGTNCPNGLGLNASSTEYAARRFNSVTNLPFGHTTIDVQGRGNYAFALQSVNIDSQFDGIELAVYEVTTSTPELVGSFVSSDLSSYDRPSNLIVDDSYAYIAASSSLIVYDVGNVTEVTEHSRTEILSGGDAFRAIVKYGNLVYGVTALGLVTIDVTDPSAPVMIASSMDTLEINGTIPQAKVDNGILYIFSNSNTFTPYVYKYDVYSDPRAPAYIGVEELADNGINGIMGADVVDGYYYIRDGNTVIALQAHYPASTSTVMGAATSPDSCTSADIGLVVANKRAYFACVDGGLSVFDITDPTNVIYRGSKDIGFDTLNDGGTKVTSVDGSRIYIGSVGHAFVVDMGGISTDALVAGGAQFGYADVLNDMRVGGRMRVGDSLVVGRGGIASDGDITVNGSKVCLENGTNCGSRMSAYASEHPLSQDNFVDVFAKGDFAYFAMSAVDQVEIYNLVDPTDPQTNFNQATPRMMYSSLVGNRWYAVDDAGILYVYRLDGFMEPSVIGSIDLVNDLSLGVTSSVRFIVQGDYLFLVSDGVLVSLNVSDPSNITLVSDESAPPFLGVNSMRLVAEDGNFFLMYKASANPDPDAIQVAYGLWNDNGDGVINMDNQFEVPGMVGTEDTNVALVDKRLFVQTVSAGESVINVYDVSGDFTTLLNPPSIDTINPPGDAISHFEAVGNRLYIASHDAFDVDLNYFSSYLSEPEEPYVLEQTVNNAFSKDVAGYNTQRTFALTGKYAIGPHYDSADNRFEIMVINLGGFSLRNLYAANAGFGDVALDGDLNVDGMANFSNDITVRGLGVCLSDGTNCPSSVGGTNVFSADFTDPSTVNSIANGDDYATAITVNSIQNPNEGMRMFVTNNGGTDMVFSDNLTDVMNDPANDGETDSARISYSNGTIFVGRQDMDSEVSSGLTAGQFGAGLVSGDTGIYVQPSEILLESNSAETSVITLRSGFGESAIAVVGGNPNGIATADAGTLLLSPGSLLPASQAYLKTTNGGSTGWQGIVTADMIGFAPSERVIGTHVFTEPFPSPLDVQVTGTIGIVSFEYVDPGVLYAWKTFDLSDPANPVVLYEDPGASSVIVALQVDGTVLYIVRKTGATTNVESWDMTDPSAPTLLNTLDLVLPGYQYNWAATRISGTKLYTVTDGTLSIVDISNPSALALDSQLPSFTTHFGNRNDLVVDGNYVYYAGNPSFPDDELVVIDVSNPLVPSVAATLIVPGFGVSPYLKLVGTSLYWLQDSAITVIDISNPLVPVIDSATTPGGLVGFLSGFTIDGSDVYASDDSQIAKYDISDLSTPTDSITVTNGVRSQFILNGFIVGINSSALIAYELTATDPTRHFGSNAAWDGTFVNVSATNIMVGGFAVCLADGTNCPGGTLQDAYNGGRSITTYDGPLSFISPTSGGVNLYPTNDITAVSVFGGSFGNATSAGFDIALYTSTTNSSMPTGTFMMFTTDRNNPFGGSATTVYLQADISAGTIGLGSMTGGSLTVGGINSYLGSGSGGTTTIQGDTVVLGSGQVSIGGIIGGLYPVYDNLSNFGSAGNRWNGFFNSVTATTLVLGAPADPSITTAYASYMGYSSSSVNGGLCIDDMNTLGSCPMFGINGASIIAEGSINANAYDLAERYRVSGPAEPGDVVIFDTTTSTSVQVSGAERYNRYIAGVVSTKPGFVLGWGDGAPVALSGRVPTKVSVTNGEIKVGDALTTSEYPGYAMKATKPGMILGYALEDVSATGTIEVFIDTGYNAMATLGTDGSIAVIKDDIVVKGLESASASTSTSDSFGLTFHGEGWDTTSSIALAYDFTLRTDMLSTTNARFVIENSFGSSTFSVDQEGVVRANAFEVNDSFDLAERYESADTLEPGDLIMISPDADRQILRANGDQAVAIGVISTKAGFTLGANASGTYPVALAGRVPTKVTTLNGEIKRGDALVASSIPGVAQKATVGGQIIGYALENYAGSDNGLIESFIQPGLWIPKDKLEAIGSASTSTGSGTGAARQGFAKIVTGGSRVHIAYTSINAFPVPQVTAMGNVSGGWWLENVTDAGFDIVMDTIQPIDIQFAWQVSPSQVGIMQYSSDGTYGQLDPLTGQLVNEPEPEAPPESEAEEPPVEEPPTE